MKTITIKNLKLQFDSFDEGADQHNAHEMVDEINKVIQQRFSDASPLIHTTGLDDDIEIKDPDIEDQVEF